MISARRNQRAPGDGGATVGARAWRLRLCMLGCVVWLSTFAPSARAWNAHGHMLIALYAYDALSPPKRAAFARLLAAHPRYREDLLAAVPAGLTSEAERSRWLFAHASTWPDLVSRESPYAHGTWHYVNLPLERRGAELWTCREARRAFPESVRRVAEVDAARRARGEAGIPAGDSILAALPKNRAILTDPAAPAAERALALSWVLHLVGDAHQPLHGVALFTSGRFVTGDRGGNDITIGERSLHRVWDGALGDDTQLPALDSALAALRMPPLARAEQAAAKKLDADTWVDEDCELARRAVYTPAILASVSRFEAQPRSVAPVPGAAGAAGAAGPGEPPPKPDKPAALLPPEYFAHATDASRERALRAGLRLAAILAAVPLGESTGPR